MIWPYLFHITNKQLYKYPFNVLCIKGAVVAPCYVHDGSIGEKFIIKLFIFQIMYVYLTVCSLFRTICSLSGTTKPVHV